MTRSVLVCVLLASSVASADTGMLPNNATVRWNRFFIRQSGNFEQPRTIEVRRQYLNLAHCACSAAGAGDQTTFQYEISLTADTGTNRPGEVWVGTQCDDNIQRPMRCELVDSVNNIDQLAIAPTRVEVSLAAAINGNTMDTSCRQANGGTSTIWFLVDSNADSQYDYFGTQSLGNDAMTTMADTVSFDTQPPPLPSGLTAGSAEGGISLSWTPPVDIEDVFYYQALCAKQDGSPGVSSPDEAKYQTVRTVCGLEQDVTLEPLPTKGGDNATDDEEEDQEPLVPQAMRQLDPTFICGTSAEPSATGMLIKGLENGTKYSVVLLAIDLYGNASAGLISTTVTPTPATDFWEDLHNRGSNVEGGFCLSASGGNGRPLSAGLVAIVALLVVRRRRRSRRAVMMIAPLFAGGALLAIAGEAQAQGRPYWEDDAAAGGDAGEVTWHTGVRVGPYVPDIDKQFGMEPGPYGEMFGDYQIMPMLDIDRIIWRGFGQLGIGGSIGYMQKTAKAWADGSIPGAPMRERSTGDTNTFRPLPLALTAVYRFTYLDDRFGIPIVPYVRGGLSYYLWWFRTNGETSSACWDGTQTPDCDADKAIGATIGVQGSLGVAIRAERIDPDAATSMRASGIQHAGFYAELSLAKVDGFGRDEKLSVGDTTWFAGVNFEF